MVITSTEAYLGAIGLGALRGARVGWRKEALTSTIVLGTVLFLSTGGDGVLANLIGGFSSGSTATAQAAALSGGTVATTVVSAPSSCSLGLQAAVSKVVFVVMSFLGYWVGRTQGTDATLTHHRITGIIPGAVNGAAIAYYGTKSFFNGQDVLIGTPTVADTTNFMPLIFGGAVIGLLVIMFVSAQAKKTYAKK